MSHFDYKAARRAEAHRKLTREQQRFQLLDAAVENAWLADQCIRLALAIFEDGIDVKAIAFEILQECNLRDVELDLHSTPKKIDRDKIQQVLSIRTASLGITPEKMLARGIALGQKNKESGHAASMGTKEGRHKTGLLAAKGHPLSRESCVKGGLSPIPNHICWHVKRGIVKADCPLCCGEQGKAAGAAAGE